MSKAWRHIELMPVFRCKLKSLMLQKGGGTPPHIHDHIAYRAPCATNQLGLRVRSSLIMHAPDRALVGGKRNILLHIVRQQATLAKFLPAHGTGEHRSEEHTSELQSLMRISYAVFCLKKKNSKHK